LVLCLEFCRLLFISDLLYDALEDLEGKLQKGFEERKKLEATLTEAEQLYFNARGGINQLEDVIRKATRKLQEKQILVNQIKEKLSSVKFEISSVAQRLKIEFDIDANDIINDEAPQIEDPDGLQMKVEKIKRRLDNYGEINPMAVEAYDEMKERYDKIKIQRDDILEAKESLLSTIKEIEETATIQFLEAFEKVRVYFIDVFRSLFTEDDNCDLILIDPENPLETKIEIVAKPKGKRPQTISQLSGGEKTLTATALLFALYLLKPAPFCIFDEVDAPLDDANITKFNKIIKKFSKDSQFIIVTHNKLTMAAVDTIYGVYMAEQGISGVSPVDFRDFEDVISFERSAS
ncbi:MAG: AAA family ATPase, partial [Bacteroidota bacterium]